MASLSLCWSFSIATLNCFQATYPVSIVWPGPPSPHIYTLPHSNIMLEEEALLYRFHGQNTIHASERRAGTLLQI